MRGVLRQRFFRGFGEPGSLRRDTLWVSAKATVYIEAAVDST